MTKYGSKKSASSELKIYIKIRILKYINPEARIIAEA
jgi:hypothetical protein